MCFTYDPSLLNECFDSRMPEDHGWMYGGWKKGGAHMKEWIMKSQEFIDCAFSLANNGGVKCPCIKCRKFVCEDKMMLSLYLCKVGFMLDYEVWVHHGESVHQTASIAEDDDTLSDDWMDEMLDAIWLEFGTNPKDFATLEVQNFFNILTDTEEPLHEHTIVSVLTFVTRLIPIKSKFVFSNICYKELLNLISDVLPMNHMMLKYMYQSKNCFLL
jgi:hypothetical protein